MRISDWSSDVCSSDLMGRPQHAAQAGSFRIYGGRERARRGGVSRQHWSLSRPLLSRSRCKGEGGMSGEAPETPDTWRTIPSYRQRLVHLEGEIAAPASLVWDVLTNWGDRKSTRLNSSP